MGFFVCLFVCVIFNSVGAVARNEREMKPLSDELVIDNSFR